MDSPESRRNAVISAANLLMVSLLKLNRVLVPALLRWVRSRRKQWIRRAAMDVARDFAADQTRRRLCAGSCCGAFYGSLDVTSIGTTTSVDNRPANTSDASSTDDTQPSLAHPSTSDVVKPSPSSNMTSNHTLAPLPPGPPSSSAVAMSDETYYRLRVAEEERHRSGQIDPMVYTSVMQVYFTLGTLTLFSALIISIVLLYTHFQPFEAIIFSFTLIATATISESETLLQIKTSPTKKRRRAAVALSRVQASDVAPVLSDVPMPGLTPDGGGGGGEVGAKTKTSGTPASGGGTGWSTVATGHAAGRAIDAMRKPSATGWVEAARSLAGGAGMTGVVGSGKTDGDSESDFSDGSR